LSFNDIIQADFLLHLQPDSVSPNCEVSSFFFPKIKIFELPDGHASFMPSLLFEFTLVLVVF
jgi:hypothetical protein